MFIYTYYWQEQLGDVVSRTDFPNTDRSIRIFDSTSAALLGKFLPLDGEESVSCHIITARNMRISRKYSKKYLNIHVRSSSVTLVALAFSANWASSFAIFIFNFAFSDILLRNWAAIAEVSSSVERSSPPDAYDAIISASACAAAIASAAK